MCIRTVEGNDIVVQSLDTVSGEYNDSGRYVSHKQTNIVLAGTTPTMTEIDGPASGTYTTPSGCVYIDVYVVGAGGGGAGGSAASADVRYGGGGAGGDVAFGIFPAGSYAYALFAGGAAGGAGASGTAAAQFSTFNVTTKASGGNGGSLAFGGSETSTGPWGNSVSLLPFGRQRGMPAGNSPAHGGYNMFNGQGGIPTRNTVNDAGDKGALGGGGAGGTRAAAGAAGANSYLLIIEYY